MRRGCAVTIQARAVIMATGGYAELWRWTDTEPGLTGEGIYLAFQAGADVLVRGVELVREGGWSARVDVGLQTQPREGATSDFGGPDALYAVKEIGDLRDFGALREIDASARRVNARALAVDRTFRLRELMDLLQL